MQNQSLNFDKKLDFLCISFLHIVSITTKKPQYAKSYSHNPQTYPQGNRIKFSVEICHNPSFLSIFKPFFHHLRLKMVIHNLFIHYVHEYHFFPQKVQDL